MSLGITSTNTILNDCQIQFDKEENKKLLKVYIANNVPKKNQPRLKFLREGTK